LAEDEAQQIPQDRREMFRHSFFKLMKPIAEYIEERFDLQLPVVPTVLRPPGALPEKDFLDTCYRCGNCVDICPARAIRTISSEDIEDAGTPYIDPDLAACVLCDELACMDACPSGALKNVAQTKDIRMGLACVNHQICIRTKGENCRLCLEKCPLGNYAIDLSDRGDIRVKNPGCVGCGTCQFYCPTIPKAIHIDF